MTNQIKYYILSRLTKKYILRGVAQLVARHIWDVDAAGSTPVTPTKIAVSTSVGTAIFFVFDSNESNLMEVLALRKCFGETFLAKSGWRVLKFKEFRSPSE